MTQVNKLTLIALAVILAAFIAAFCTIIVTVLFVKDGHSILIAVPTILAVAYGVYAFVKKYNPDRKVK